MIPIQITNARFSPSKLDALSFDVAIQPLQHATSLHKTALAQDQVSRIIGTIEATCSSRTNQGFRAETSLYYRNVQKKLIAERLNSALQA